MTRRQADCFVHLWAAASLMPCVGWVGLGTGCGALRVEKHGMMTLGDLGELLEVRFTLPRALPLELAPLS